MTNEAKSLYSIVSETKISRGSNRKGIIAACVYFACKECNVPRSSKEIAEMFSITSNVMTKGVKKCQEIISMNKNNKKRLTTSSSTKPGDFIDRFCNRLNLKIENIHIIHEICKIAVDNNLICENTPPSIAAGCIYYFIKQNDISISKKDISDVCKISEVTINKCSKKLETNESLFSKIKE
jgi:transcription initiation factor TFIIB